MPLVLVVDDHPGIAHAVAAMVRVSGFDSAVVHCGQAALDFLSARPADLVVLDVSMPGESGPDVLRAMASLALLARTSVVMYSASDECRDECLRLGAVEFVRKDDAGGLLNMIRKHVSAKVETS